MNSNQGQQEQQQGELPNCGDMIARLPLWTRILYFSFAIAWLLDLLTGFPRWLLAAKPDTTFSSLWLWTLLTSIVYVQYLFMVILIIYNMHTFLPKIQQKYSSVVVMVKMLINHAIIISITILLYSFISYDPLQPPAFGVGGIWFNMLTKYCHHNSQRKIKFCCFGCKIPKTVYPFVLLGVLMFLNWSLHLDMWVGLLLALVEVRIEDRFSPCSGRSLFEKVGAIMPCRAFPSWVPLGVSQNQDFRDSTLFQLLEDFELSNIGHDSGDRLQKSAVDDPFAGKQGTRLDDY